MATTPTPGKQVAVITATTTAETRQQPLRAAVEKAGGWIKEHLFVLFLLIAVLITVLVLQANGFRGKFGFPLAMTIIISVYNAVIMVWPLVLAFRKRQHLKLRLSIIAASVLLGLVVVFEVRLLDSFGASIWAIPFLGPVILPIGAVALLGYVALLLTHYGPKGSEMVIQQGKAKILALEAEIAGTTNQRIATNRQVEACALVKAELQSAFESQDAISTKCAEAYQAAKKLLEECDANTKARGLEETLKENKRKREEGALRSLELDLMIKKTAAAGVKAQFQAEYSDLDNDLKALVIIARKLQANLDTTKVLVEESPEKKAMDDALAISDSATKEAAKARVRLEAADNKAKDADAAHSLVSIKLQLAEDDVADTSAHITEAENAEQGKWRDVAFGPIVALLLSFLLYTSWYGWVVVTFH